MFLTSYTCFLFKLFKRNLTTLFVLVYIAMGGCGTIPDDDQGEIIGDTKNVMRKSDVPLDMVLIPAGTFLMGGGVNQGVIGQINQKANESVGSFYMDKYPVTNAQYRKFIAIVEADPAAYELSEADIKKLMPDPTVWRRDFGFMFMDDSFAENYYKHARFNDYPVVGITWEAAQQFARVRTIRKNKYLEAKGLPLTSPFRLPTAAEWEYAAKGGRYSGQYPWGGPVVRDQKGKLLANFQVTKGNYAASGYAYTSPVKAFPPNDYSLYDMAGNVAEWCEDVYSPLLVHKSRGISPFYKDEEGPFRVIKGGSWKDYSYALQTGVLDCERKDVARCYIGFRCVMSAV